MSDLIDASAAVQARFDDKWQEDPITGCHLWTASVQNCGYGMFHARHGMMTAHKAAWLLAARTIDPGLSLMHTCDEVRAKAYPDEDPTTYRRCCNVDHIQMATHSTNMRQMRNLGRRSDITMSPIRVQMLREMRKSFPEVRQAVWGRLFGLDKNSVNGVVRGVSWRDIEFPDADWDPKWRIAIDFDAKTVEQLPAQVETKKERPSRAKPVWSPLGRFHSLTEAAKANDVHISTASYRANKCLDGWRYE